MAAKPQLLAIGAHNGLTARLGQRAGFDAIWASGFEISAAHGVPDANILDQGAQLAAAVQIQEAVSIPVIADCDNGYGNAIHAAVTAAKYARAGIAAICIEDNDFPKRCSFYSDLGRRLVSAREHALKVAACKDSTHGELFVIARTEALIAGLGIDEALERLDAYAEGGADAVLIHSKSKTPDEILAFCARWQRPIPLVVVPTTYDSISAADLAAAGCRIVIFANQGLRAAIRAIQVTYRELLAAGHASVLQARIASLPEVFDLVGVEDLERRERRFLPSGQ